MPTPPEFATATRMTGPLSVVYALRGGGAAVTARVADPYVILGRHSLCTIQLSDPSVSKRHVYAQNVDGHVFVIDLHSRRGTQVGGAFVSQGWLRPGQTLQVGEFDVRFFPDPPPTSLSPPDRGAGLPLVLVLPEAMPVVCPLRGPVSVIGRDRSTQVRVADDRLDPFHAAVVRTEASAWVVSLLGPGGVRVEGRQVRVGRIEPGSRLQLNGVDIRVEVAPAESSGHLALTPAPVAPRDEFRDLAVFLAQKFATFQEEQTELLKRQTELLQVIADACRRGALPLAGVAGGPPATPPPPADVRAAPVPQPLIPREADTLEDIHDWLLHRLQEIQPKSQ